MPEKILLLTPLSVGRNELVGILRIETYTNYERSSIYRFLLCPFGVFHPRLSVGNLL
jgi:hypothetical protein